MSNPTPNSILQERVEKAAKVMKASPDDVWKALEEIGIEKDDEDALALLEADTTTQEDADPKFLDVGIKKARFRAGWAILKGKSQKTKDKPETSTTDSTTAELIKTLRSVKQYKDKELLEAYGPDCSSDVLDEIRRRSNDRPFLVYDGENLDVDTSLEMLRVARRQPTNEQHVFHREGKSKVVRLLRPGQFPTLWIEESPIHPEVILVDGYCHKCDNSWSGVSMDDRVIVRIAVDVDGVDVSSKARIHELITRIRESGADFLLDVPSVKVRYDELEELNRLPILRRRATSGGGKDPLFVKHRTY